MAVPQVNTTVQHTLIPCNSVGEMHTVVPLVENGWRCRGVEGNYSTRTMQQEYYSIKSYTHNNIITIETVQ